MIRRFCKWYSRKFPEPPKVGYHKSPKPWKVVVTLTTLGGLDTWEEVEYFVQDEYKDFMGKYWLTARSFAMDRLYCIKEDGYTHWVDNKKVHYPIHRVHRVEAMPSVEREV